MNVQGQTESIIGSIYKTAKPAKGAKINSFFAFFARLAVNF